MSKKEVGNKSVRSIGNCHLTGSNMFLYSLLAMDDSNDQPVEPTIAPVGEKSPSSKADTFLDLENLIKSYISRLDGLKEELRKQKELYESSFKSDAVYMEHEEKAKDANKTKTETKQQILKQPTLAAMSEKINDIRDEIKELQTTLSDYLLQYQKLSGFNEIEVGDGETMIIVNSARLVKGSSRS